MSMSYKPSLLSSSLVNTGVEVHEQTANLASVLVTESPNEDENEDDLEQQQQEQHHREEESQDHQHSLSESSLLMPNSPRNNYFSQADALESEIGSPSVNSLDEEVIVEATHQSIPSPTITIIIIIVI